MENNPLSTPVSPSADLGCPRCGLLNAPHTLRCACGYQLQSETAVPGQSWSQTAEANHVPVPKLHWGLLLVLSLVTFGIFLLIWGFRQGFWARQAEPGNKVLVYYSIYVVAIVLEVAFAVSPDLEAISVVFRLVGGICFILGSFSVKSAIESHLNKRLNGVLTFLFGPIYNQYKLNEKIENSLSIMGA